MIDFRYIWILFGILVFAVVLHEISGHKPDMHYFDYPNPDHHLEPLDQDPPEKFGHHNHPHPHPHDPNQPPANCCPHGPGMRPKEDDPSTGTLA